METLRIKQLLKTIPNNQVVCLEDLENIDDKTLSLSQSHAFKIEKNSNL